tara:strand:+ start:459 stop:683 length:225 start_codon:yes stop_codon:yes gene_type:complete
MLSLSCQSLKADFFRLMRKKKHIEDLICSSLTEILERSTSLDRKDQIAIYQEFKEWIHGDTNKEDIWVIDPPIK